LRPSGRFVAWCSSLYTQWNNKWCLSHAHKSTISCGWLFVLKAIAVKRALRIPFERILIFTQNLLSFTQEHLAMPVQLCVRLFKYWNLIYLCD